MARRVLERAGVLLLAMVGLGTFTFTLTLTLTLSFTFVPAPAAAQNAEVEGEIVDFDILPDELTLVAGETISWVNDGDRPHTVTDRGGMFDTNPILPGERASVTLPVPGTYEIFCRINPSSMNAKLVVEPGPEAPAAVRVEAIDELREGESQRFEPAQLEVATGTELILANVGGLPHSLRTTDGNFRIPVVEPGAEQGRFAGGNASVVLTKPGDYEFFCDLHPDTMRGTVVVTGDEIDEDDRPPPTGLPPPDVETPERAGDAAIVDFAFEPTEVSVQPGASITWANNGRQAHSVTFDDLELDTGILDAGQSATLEAPADAGTYSYFCLVHPAMRGALLVQAPEVAEVAAPPAPAEPPDGTAFAYALAAAMVATGAGGLVLALRH